MGFKIGKLISGGAKLLSGDLSGIGDVAGAFGGGGGGGGGNNAGTSAGFTPYSITSGIATSKVDPTAKTATYTLTPQMQAFRDQYYAGATAALPSSVSNAYGQQVSDYGRGLFSQAANMDTGAMTSDYFNKNLRLLEPARKQESSRLNDLMFSRGTIGQGVGMGGGYVNPQQFALQQAREQQNAALALSAEDRARAIQGEQFQRAGALYGLGQSYLTDPYNTANQIMNYGIGIENLGSNTMAQGLNTGISVGQISNQAAQVNSAVNQQNYLRNLANENANNAAWTSAGNAIGNVDWGGLFSRNSMPASQGDFNSYYNMNA